MLATAAVLLWCAAAHWCPFRFRSVEEKAAINDLFTCVLEADEKNLPRGAVFRCALAGDYMKFACKNMKQEVSYPYQHGGQGLAVRGRRQGLAGSGWRAGAAGGLASMHRLQLNMYHSLCLAAATGEVHHAGAAERSV